MPSPTNLKRAFLRYFAWRGREHPEGGNGFGRPRPASPVAGMGDERSKGEEGAPTGQTTIDHDSSLDLGFLSSDASTTEIALVEHMALRLEAMNRIARAKTDGALIEELRRTVLDRDFDLPRIPKVASELMSLTTESKLANKQVGNLVARDQQVAAKILQVANSPRFTRNRIVSLDHAVSALGFEMFRQVAVGAALGAAVFKAPGFDSLTRNERRHAFKTALVASRLAAEHGHPDLEPAAFLCGLFHDVGKVLVLRSLARIRRKIGGNNPSRTLVRRVMHELHIPFGLVFCHGRELPVELRDAVTYHHRPGRAPDRARPTLALVAAADLVGEHANSLWTDEGMERGARIMVWQDDMPPFAKLVRAAFDISMSETGDWA